MEEHVHWHIGKFDISEFYQIRKEIALVIWWKCTGENVKMWKCTGENVKMLLWKCTGAWVKNDDNPLFDVTMGSFDSAAEECELVGLYLLSIISVLTDSDNVGL